MPAAKGEELLSLSNRGRGFMRVPRRTGTPNPETNKVIPVSESLTVALSPFVMGF